MSRAKFLFTISVLAFIAFLLETITGFVLWLVLPRGGNQGGIGGGLDGNESTFIWARNVWVDVHDWAAVALLLIISIHIYMHWQWLYRQTKGILKLR